MIGTERGTKTNTIHGRGRVITSLAITMVFQSINAQMITLPFDTHVNYKKSRNSAKNRTRLEQLS